MVYNFVGYGSLLSHKSLSKTIPDREFRPVIVKGYKRIFNLALKKSKDSDVLNVQSFVRSKFNGVLFQLNDEDLEDLMRREFAYDLEEAWVYDFFNGKKLCKAFVVVDNFVAIDKRKRKPNRAYFKLCREAAYEIGEDFGVFWDDTTFTSDGEKISDWIRKNKSYL